MKGICQAILQIRSHSFDRNMQFLILPIDLDFRFTNLDFNYLNALIFFKQDLGVNLKLGLSKLSKKQKARFIKSGLLFLLFFAF